MMNNAAPPKYGMGAPVRRKEDRALVTGRGRFTDDYTPEGTLRAVVLRSTMAHARFTLGDLSEVAPMPGVRLILTDDDHRRHRRAALQGRDPPDRRHPPEIAAASAARQGHRCAMSATRSPSSSPTTSNAAKAAAEAIEVDYEPLPAVVDMKAAVEPGAPLVWPEFGTNVAFEAARGEQGATPTRLSPRRRASRASRSSTIASSPTTWKRAASSPNTTPDTDRYTLTMGTQGGHGMRDIIAKDILQHPADARSASSRPMSAAASAPSPSSITSIRWRRSPPSGSAGRSSGSASAASTSSSTPTAATTSPSPRWRWTRTASSSPCASTCSPIWAPISPSTGRTSRMAA